MNKLFKIAVVLAVGASAFSASARPAQGASSSAATQSALRQPAPSVLTARTVALGASHSCAITLQGGVKCWGNNQSGQLGDGTTESRTAPVDVRGLRNARAVTAGAAHTCALLANGSVKCWGSWIPSLVPTEGRNSTVPEDVPELDRDVTALAAGGEHTCALNRQGRVLCWGSNASGQLGSGRMFEIRDTPAEVEGLSGKAQAIAAGRNHTCALLERGEIECWGDNIVGQLGADEASTGGVLSPVRVQGLGGRAQAITAGAEHTCALTERGEVLCWGSNREGQLGDGVVKQQSGISRVVGLPKPARQIAAGARHTCAVLTDGSAACWGEGDFGKLGDGQWLSSPVPLAVFGLSRGVREIAAGGGHTCAVLESNQVLCWGESLQGQLGTRESGQSRTPVTVVGLTGAVQVAAADTFTCALTQAGGARCWGANYYGRLGNAGTTDSLTPADVVNLSASVRAIALGRNHACAITTGGRVRCWGNNSSGQLGDGTTESRSTPVGVQGLTGARAIALGSAHTCALLEAGNVRCWGNNEYGQLGEGTTAERRTPVADVRLDGRARAIASGSLHACALMIDGKVKCWGRNEEGQLGDGTTTTARVPVEVKGLDGEVITIDASRHTCALMRDGSIRCWGANFYGEPGDGTRQNALKPVRVQGLSGKARALALGDDYTCALMENGAVQCWGSNLYGQLGSAEARDDAQPRAIRGLAAPAQSIAAGENHICAVLNTSAVQCWGRNFAGELGNGTSGYRTLPAEVVSQ